MPRLPMARATLRQQPEKVEQARIVQLAASLGAKYYVLGTRRSRGKPCPSCGTFVPEDQGTRQTPGLPDLELFLKRPPARPDYPHARLQLRWEVKAPGGRRSTDQEEFATWAADAGVEYGCGAYDDFVGWCIRNGYLSAQNVPHYRQPRV